MTRQQQHFVKCAKCGSDVDTSTPFSEWLRQLPPPHDSSNYSAQNLDYVWFHYQPGWLITIEEKRFDGKSSSSQQDVHSIVSQLLTIASDSTVKTMRGERPIQYRGHYVVVFEKTTPEDSAWVKINGERFDSPKEAVLRLLKDGNTGVIQLVSHPTNIQIRKWLEAQPISVLIPLARWCMVQVEKLYKAQPEQKDKTA